MPAKEIYKKTGKMQLIHPLMPLWYILRNKNDRNPFHFFSFLERNTHVLNRIR